MTAQVVALYKRPEDVKAFEEHYFSVHSPLVEKMPGMRDFQVYRSVYAPMGGEPGFYMMAVMTFDSVEDAKTAMSSPPGMEAGKDLMSFAKGGVHLIVSETAKEGTSICTP